MTLVADDSAGGVGAKGDERADSPPLSSNLKHPQKRRMSVTCHYRVGPFLLDPSRRVLSRDEQPVALTARAFDVLAALVERAGRTVDKDELLRAVWPDTVVEEANLSQQIFTIRKLLGQSDDHSYITTVPGAATVSLPPSRNAGKTRPSTLKLSPPPCGRPPRCAWSLQKKTLWRIAPLLQNPPESHAAPDGSTFAQSRGVAAPEPGDAIAFASFAALKRLERPPASSVIPQS